MYVTTPGNSNYITDSEEWYDQSSAAAVNGKDYVYHKIEIAKNNSFGKRTKTKI